MFSATKRLSIPILQESTREENGDTWRSSRFTKDNRT
jgi:hypothetical protein